MINRLDLVVIDGIDYMIDFRNGRFNNLLQPEVSIDFESQQGKQLCQMYAIEKCEHCHRYVQKLDFECPFCEHLLLCE